MRLPFLILFLLYSTFSLSGQIKKINKIDAKVYLNSAIINKEIVIDSIPFVEYAGSDNKNKHPAYYVNGKFMNASIIKTINHNLIDSIYIEKEEVNIHNNKYYGNIFLKMKDEYHPTFISLAKLKKKYLPTSNKQILFMLDEEIIKSDYNDFWVDEKYILKMIVETVENKDEKIDIEVVRLLTKSEENIRKSKEIKIKGASGRDFKK